MKQRSHHRPPLVELFANVPRGLALLELKDPEDASTWRLVSINDFASSVVVPSIDTFLSTEKLGLAGATDVASLYREIINDGRTRTIGIVESQNTTSNGEVRPPSQYRLYKVFTIESTGAGTAVSAVFPLQSAEEKHAEAAGGEERKSRAAGKPLESAELRIEDLASGTNGGAD